MDEVSEDPTVAAQTVDDWLFTITVDAATLALLGTSPDELLMGSDSIPVDRGFDEAAWEAQLRVDLADLAEHAWDADVPPDPGSPVRFDPALGVLGFDSWPGVSARDRVDRVVEIRRHLSRLQALERRELAALTAGVEAQLPAGAGNGEREWAHRSLLAELSVACRVSKPTMAGRIEEAGLIVHAFPATLDALEEGRIEAGHLRVIAQHGALIDDDQARARYEQLVLERAAEVTPGRLGSFAQLTAARVGKVSFQDRHRAAREGRCVRLRTGEDGMSEVFLSVPTVLATPIWDRLTAQATAIRQDNTTAATSDDGGATANDGATSGDGAGAADPRTFDQIRADLACELLLTGQPSGDPDAPHRAGIGIRAEVSVVIPVLSLLGKSKDPALIPGRGPIGLDDACRLAADAPELLRILTHPITGMVLNVDSYRPSKRLRQYLEARDGRCRFPTCNRNPKRTELDHTFDWHYGGKTKPDNLECLCKGDHRLKHQTGWRVRQTAPGALEWTSPQGRVITDLPDRDIPGSTIGDSTLGDTDPPF